MKIRPLQDRLIVRRIAAETQSPGGIIIPPTASEKPVEGLVLAVGPTVKGAMVLGESTVLFGRYAGTEVKLDNEDYLILREDDVLAVIER